MNCLDLKIVWSCCVKLVDWQRQRLWLELMLLVSYQGNIFMYSMYDGRCNAKSILWHSLLTYIVDKESILMIVNFIMSFVM